MPDAFTAPPLAELFELSKARQTFDRAVADLAVKPGERAEDAVLSVFAAAVRAHAYEPLRRQISERIHGIYDLHTLMEGEREALPPEEQSAWDETLGDQLEAFFAGDIGKACGQGWIGENTIGPRFDQDGVLNRIAASAATRLAERLGETAEPLPFGLSQADLAALGEAALARGRTEKPRSRRADVREEEEAAVNSVNAAEYAVAGIAGHIVAERSAKHEPARKALAEEVELAVDEDDILAASALGRLHLDGAYISHFKGYKTAKGTKSWAKALVDEAFKLIENPAPEPKSNSNLDRQGYSEEPRLEESPVPDRPLPVIPESAIEPPDTSAAPPPRQRKRGRPEGKQIKRRIADDSHNTLARLVVSNAKVSERELAALIDVSSSLVNAVMKNRPTARLNLNDRQLGEVRKLVDRCQKGLGLADELLSALELGA